MMNTTMNTTMNSTNGGEGSFADSFKNRSTAMTADELRKARESRAAEALRMKDEQLRILSEQNANLLKTLDKVRFNSNNSIEFSNELKTA
jgi:hypothetical protein